MSVHDVDKFSAIQTQMEFHTSKDALIKALSPHSGVIERRSAVQVITNILIEARLKDGTHDTGEVVITGTDLELTVVSHIEATVNTSGSIAIPARIFFDIVKKLADGPLSIQLERRDNGTVVLLMCSGTSEFVLPVMPAHTFPTISTFNFSTTFSLPSNSLKQLVERTKFAMSTEDARNYLNGVFFHTHMADNHANHANNEVPSNNEVSSNNEVPANSEVSPNSEVRTNKKTPQNNKVIAVATDAHRLAMVMCKMPEGMDSIPGVIIGRKAIQELTRLLPENEQQVTIKLSSNQISFEVGAFVLYSRLIEGTFPNYQAVIPTNTDKEARITKKVLIEAIERVSSVIMEKNRVIKMSFANNSLVLMGQSQEYGKATEKLDIIYSGDAIDIWFNPFYVLDICKNIKSDEVHLLMSSKDAQSLFVDDDAKYVLMPYRV